MNTKNEMSNLTVRASNVLCNIGIVTRKDFRAAIKKRGHADMLQYRNMGFVTMRELCLWSGAYVPKSRVDAVLLAKRNKTVYIENCIKFLRRQGYKICK
jgi:hypothetical protein